MNSKSGFAPLLLVLVVAVVIVGGLWYYKANRSFSPPGPSGPTATTVPSSNASTTPTPQSSRLPSAITTKANDFLVARVGQSVFNNDLRLNANGSDYYAPLVCNATQFCIDGYYAVRYQFSFEGQPGTDNAVEIDVDATNGRVQMGAQGIPPCATTPNKCQIKISQSQAVTIANGIGMGTFSIENTTLSYNPKSDSFLWSAYVSGPSKFGGGCFSSHSVTMDGFTGAVISTSTGAGCF